MALGPNWVAVFHPPTAVAIQVDVSHENGSDELHASKTLIDPQTPLTTVVAWLFHIESNTRESHVDGHDDDGPQYTREAVPALSAPYA